MARATLLLSFVTLLQAACSASTGAEHPPRAASTPTETPAPQPKQAAQPTASPAPRPSPAIDAAAARTAAEGVWKEFVEKYEDPALKGPGDAPVCDEAGCAWKLDITVFGGSDPTTIGSLWVDAASKEILWAPNDGTSKRWKLDEHRAYQKRAEAVVRAAGALPEVKAYCARIRAQKLGCLVYVDQPPESSAPCPKQPTPGDGCLFSIYVGEAHADHASRFATILVDPDSLAIVGASDLACGPMPLEKWRDRQKKRVLEECD